MNPRSLLSLAVGLSVLAGSAAQGDEPVTLRYKFDKDRPLIYRTESAVEQSQAIGDQKIETRITQTDVTERQLKEVTDDGAFRIQAENKQLKVKINIGPLGEYKFDSSSTDRDTGSVLGKALDPIYDRMSGSELTVVLSPLGEVKKVEGYSDLLADVLKDNPIGAQFAAGGSDKAAAVGYGDQIPRLPKEPVRPGDTWEDPYNVELPRIGTVKGKRTYKLEGTDRVEGRSTVRITVTYELNLDLDVNVDGAAVTGKISSEKSSGTIQFDPVKGELVSLDTSYTLTGDITLKVNGVEIPGRLSQTQTTKSKQLEKLPD